MPEGEKIIEIPLDSIIEPDLPARSHADMEKLEDLGRSMKEVGQRTPIIVKKIGDKWKIIDGHMRYFALKMAGLNFAKAIEEKPESEEEELAWRLHSNIHIPTNPVDEAVFFDKIMKKLGLTPSELAQTLKRSEAYIRERLKILNFPEEIKEALLQEQISLGVAKELSRLESDLLRNDFLRRAIRDGLTESRARVWVEEYSGIRKEEPPPPPEVIEAKLKELEEYYTIPCEICGEKIKKIEWGSLQGHITCLQVAKGLALQKLEEMRREEEKKAQETK